ncbi:unnamed protein product [Zymoseptoria tritici ST99CH_1A5]|uniref:t-SNARE coiled-coil homology domain-containing protein n=4 Tax=Zymoseptoria tritici TaxID=1047171 RepID=F9XAA1_ZYMTI|nr:uncharacterized protein MYCGRDRAFT_104274 [Zymoseptoria tritici IPO323]EGP88265.1 hypothetical protein MYCGRDRAFT_104274 [Zymoseptoria tritici IPO323]SMQ50211.1 unnamed protein product [Zymoseptoria tritici ST99CH_3D7]SMR51189.1 unnamed protein product [Zymoseptoria tritici ST99CH_1E4]SMY23883.1 unnamed protein product [Zymoseptoria tritici ST99CH_1A5]
MPFGLKKSDKGDGDLDSKKASLFGGRSKASKASGSPAPASNNPYAAAPPSNANPYASAPTNDPYGKDIKTDPYAKSQSSFSQPPTSSFGNLSLNGDRAAPPSYGAAGGSGQPFRNDKSPVPPGGYGGGQARYPAPGNSYGQTGGYGNSDPYGTGSSQQASRYGPSGYGGLGRSNSQDTMSTDAGRNALFGDAPTRAQQSRPDMPPQQGSAGEAGDASYSNTGGYDSTEMPGGYGSGPPRELTAEEQEDQDVEASKQEIRFIKQQDVASTRNARRIAEQAEATGRETLARLGAQGERIHNTERNLDMASNQNRLAEEKARELKTLNRSMFAVHVANPFTAKKREEAANAIALEKHQRERAQRDATREEAYGSTARAQRQQRDINGNVVRTAPGANRNLADRAKYQFEADSEDDEMENEIDDNLDAIHRGAKTLNMLGKAMGEEIDSQNKHIDRIITKTDKVDDQIAVNRARLDRIR